MNLQELEISGISHFFRDIPVFRVGMGNTYTSPDFAYTDMNANRTNNEVTKMNDKPLVEYSKTALLGEN